MSLLDSWWLDVKLGMRMLVKYPALTLSGVLGIAVAIAIAAGGLSVVCVNLLASSLPLEEGGRIVSIELWDSRLNAPEARTMADFHAWREGLRSVQEVSAVQTRTVNLLADGVASETVRVAAMSASGFRVARVRPLLGRYLTEDDERTGSAPVVVIGEEVWRNRFGSDPAILSRTIALGTRSHAIVGIMPKGFGFPVNHHFWAPLQIEPAAPEPLTGPPLAVFARLAPGVTMENARAEVAALGQRRALAFPSIYAALRPSVASYTASAFKLQGSGEVAAIIAMQGMVVALLVLVCLNVAILVYTRTAMREAEIGLRTALGAARGRIVMQLFIEALVLSVVAAVAGVAIAAVVLRQVASATESIAADMPYWLSFRLSPEAVFYAGALCVLAAVIVGVVPGLRATGRRLRTGLRVVGAGETGMRLGKTWSILIVAQVGCAVALLPMSVLHVLENLPHTLAGPGFAAEEYLTAQLSMDSSANPGAAGFDRFAARHAELMRRVAADPRVSSSTFARSEPGDERSARVEAEGAPGVIHEVRFNQVDLNFLGVFDVPVLAGRGFAAGDIAPARPGDPPQGGAIVVNQPLAERLFGGNALGRRIRYVAGFAPVMEEPGRWYEIAGIVSNFPTGVSPGMRDSPLKVYHPVGAGQLQPAVLAMRVRGAPATFGQRLREIAAAVDPGLLVRNARGLEDALRKEQWIVRLEAALVLAVTVSVLLLASAGIYALMSFTVSQRRREIGIRLALGASRASIISSIFSRALVQLGSGVALGLGLWAIFNKTRGSQVSDAAVSLVAVVLVMMIVGLLAVVGPVRRGLKIQPADALRQE